MIICWNYLLLLIIKCRRSRKCFKSWMVLLKKYKKLSSSIISHDIILLYFKIIIMRN